MFGYRAAHDSQNFEFRLKPVIESMILFALPLFVDLVGTIANSFFQFQRIQLSRLGMSRTEGCLHNAASLVNIIQQR